VRVQDVYDAGTSAIENDEERAQLVYSSILLRGLGSSDENAAVPAPTPRIEHQNS